MFIKLFWLLTINLIFANANDADMIEDLSKLSLIQLWDIISQIPSHSNPILNHPRRSLLSTTDPAQEIVTVRSHASNYHQTMVGGSDVDKLQPLYQPALEGFYPANGYETATPQCRRIFNRYAGKCMLGGQSSGARFQQIQLKQQHASSTRSTKLQPQSQSVPRGQDPEFVNDMNFAKNIIDN